MPGFAQVFGGNTLYPSMANYQNLQLTASVTLTWPTEQQIAGQSVASSIIDLNASTINLTVTLPSAQLVSPGYVITFNNLGANAVTILNTLGNTLLSVNSGQVWTLYLADNSTPQGTWRIYQQGVGTSIANAASLAGQGLQAVGSFLNQVMPVNEQVANYTIQVTDQADVLVWQAGSGAFALQAPSVYGQGWFCAVKNLGSGTLTIIPSSGLIDLASTKALNVQDSLFIGCDGTQFFTVGFGRAVASAFNFVSINVAGSGTFVLSGAQLNQVSYRFTGALTGTRTIQVPSSVQQYWIDNETTGAFTLFIATATQSPGLSVAQGQQAILFCDGTNVLTANSSAVSFPISAVNGGTGQNAVALGDTLFGSATNLWSRLPGNTTAARQFLLQQGTGVVSAPPLWSGLQTGDLGSGVANASTFLRGNQTWSTIGTADLGSGVANAASFLRGDGTWATQLNGPFSIAGGQLTVQGLANSTIAAFTDGITKLSIGGGGPGTQIGTDTNTNLSLYTNGATRMQIAASGGILMNNPAGTVGLSVQALATSAALRATLSGLDSSQIGVDTEAYLGAGAALALRSGGFTSSQDRIIVSGNGNITVNAPSSGVTLHLIGGAGLFAAPLSITPAGTNAPIVINNGGSAASLMSIDTNFVGLGSSTGAFSANKPGGNNTTIAWIQVTVPGGVTGWIPVLGN